MASKQERLEESVRLNIHLRKQLDRARYGLFELADERRLEATQPGFSVSSWCRYYFNTSEA